MINKVIELNSVEQRLIQFVAKARYSNNRNNKVTNAKIGNQSDEETDLNGFGSEVAFARLFNSYPDMTIETRTSFEDEGDVVVNGKKIDVKTTTYKDGKLLAVPWKEKTVDLYALMVGSFPTYTFKGFMKSENLLKPERIGNLGHGDTYIAYQHELKELEELV